jgi:large subunit ribosomal protein L21
MYAVIRTGGKQYSVKVGDTVKVEKLAANVGESITLNDVLFVGGDAPKTGNPVVSGAAVTVEIVSQGKHPHIKGFTYKPKKHTHRSFGHRQLYTEIKITDITV